MSIGFYKDIIDASDISRDEERKRRFEKIDNDENKSNLQQYLCREVYYSIGRVDESIRAYEKYTELSDDPQARIWLDQFKASIKMIFLL